MYLFQLMCYEEIFSQKVFSYKHEFDSLDTVKYLQLIHIYSVSRLKITSFITHVFHDAMNFMVYFMMHIS